MKISQNLAKAINDQIGHELEASHIYLSIAGFFKNMELTLLNKIFMEQSNEERAHALKFMDYLLDTDSALEIPAIPAPPTTFASAEDAVQKAFDWEQEVTRRIVNLMSIAVGDKDYQSQSFLKWYIDEQLEEETKTQQLLSVIQRAGERNLLMIEAYLAHLDE